MDIIKNKYLWINLITVIIAAIGYAVNNNTFPLWTGYLVFADAVLNAILGVLDRQEAVKAKAALTKATSHH